MKWRSGEGNSGESIEVRERRFRIGIMAKEWKMVFISMYDSNRCRRRAVRERLLHAYVAVQDQDMLLYLTRTLEESAYEFLKLSVHN